MVQNPDLAWFGGGRRQRQERVAEDGTEPRPGMVWRRETPKTGDDGGGWYRTQTWHGLEEGDAKDGR